MFEGKGPHFGRSEREDIPGKREIGGDQIGYCRHHELQRVLAGKRSYLNSNVTKPQRMISPFSAHLRRLKFYNVGGSSKLRPV